MPTNNNTTSMRQRYREQQTRQKNIENNFVMKPVHKKRSQTTCAIKNNNLYDLNDSVSRYKYYEQYVMWLI
jgi:hypothetical protein